MRARAPVLSLLAAFFAIDCAFRPVTLLAFFALLGPARAGPLREAIVIWYPICFSAFMLLLGLSASPLAQYVSAPTPSPRQRERALATLGILPARAALLCTLQWVAFISLLYVQAGAGVVPVGSVFFLLTMLVGCGPVAFALTTWVLTPTAATLDPNKEHTGSLKNKLLIYSISISTAPAFFMASASFASHAHHSGPAEHLQRSLIYMLGIAVFAAANAALFTKTIAGPLLASLEERVAKRTAQLKAQEVELRQAQKLEAVGRLAAGVAHEINTPMQFISDSVNFAREGLRDLLAIVEDPSRAKELDLEYLQEHMPPALERAIEGLSRVTTIVRSMKEFAHPGHKEMSAVDINRAIEGTLIIAKNEYKYVADVETKLDAIPPVICNGGEMNQVFLNIIVNAAHAIGDVVKGTDERKKIAVSTRVDGADVVVAIKDEGAGIPERAREKIFEPFFTTKEVGRGTGQGLAIAHSVVHDKHGGSLTFETEEGKGTTFFIRLPIAGKPQPALLTA